MGRVFKEFQKLASTNQYALSLLSKNKPSEGTVISTSNQYSGRGQIGSTWESEPNKNICLSVIFYPNFLPANKQFQLNQAISLGVFDFISTYISKKISIKWSNDIYVENNKITGILIQNSLVGHHIQSSVVGIGINVNQKEFVTNPPNATSFYLEMGKEFDLNELKQALCESLERRYLQLKNQGITKLNQDYLNNLYQFQEEALYQKTDGEVFKGKIIGITETGKLQIASATEVFSFAIKEIKFL